MSKRKISILLLGPMIGVPGCNIDEFRRIADILHSRNYDVAIPHEITEYNDLGEHTRSEWMNIIRNEVDKHSAVMFLPGYNTNTHSMQLYDYCINKSVKVLLAEVELSEHAIKTAI